MMIRKKIYFTDTQTGKKRLFETLETGHAKIYSCGPTVYNYPHIGNFRNFAFVDVLRRTLKLFGYKVTHVMNITDIDDKIIRDARKENIDTGTLAKKYEKAFFEDCEFLRLEKVEYNPRATEHIPEMIELVRKLIKKNHTYTTEGSVYFKISSFPQYGKLSNIDLSEVKSGARVDSDEYEKEDARDFVLWKGAKEGEPFWETDFGPGRPGWHLECSAMSTKYLGHTFDIHTGAEDLVFPHHENEIAQSEAANETAYVRYWLHCAFLNMKTEKMSKSLGNVVTVRQLREQNANWAAIRYFLISVPYRKPLQYSEDAINAAATTVERYRNAFRRLNELMNSGSPDHGSVTDHLQVIEKARTEFYAGLADDLNTARALGAIFEMIRKLNIALDSNEVSVKDAHKAIELLTEADKVIAVLEDETGDDILPSEIEVLIAKRQEARKIKDFQESDRIRDLLKEKGIILEDTRGGVRWRKI